MAPQLFWVGLGNMGRGMCKNLVEKGSLDKPLLIYNRTQSRSDDLAAKLGAGKTEVVTSPADGAQRADIIFTCVSNDAAAEEAYAALTSASGGIKGKLFVECSTIHPDTTEKLAQAVVSAGGEFVASPIFGAPPAADAGQLVFVPAGPKASIERARPYMKGVMGRAEIPLEDRPYGAALKFKLIGNSFILNMVTQLAEGLNLADKSGVGTEPLKQFIDLLFGGVYSGYAERMIGGTYWKMEEPLFSADNAIKDANHMQSVAQEAGIELKNVATAKGYLEDVVKEKGGSKGDIAGIYGAARVRAGLKYDNDA
ncbi:6-phosphogluconate dehydrogenase-like protein NAD-binding protein [Xylariales sp. PMI_506]|nr:6-phosphogluconate dehydrogenase-like protein NAD-binding protein [Xylariales sp. PMI_506]